MLHPYNTIDWTKNIIRNISTLINIEYLVPWVLEMKENAGYYIPELPWTETRGDNSSIWKSSHGKRLQFRRERTVKQKKGSHQNWNLSGKGEVEDGRTVKVRQIGKGWMENSESFFYIHCDLSLFTLTRKNKKHVHDSVRLVAFNCSYCKFWAGDELTGQCLYNIHCLILAKKQPKILRIPCPSSTYYYYLWFLKWNHSLLVLPPEVTPSFDQCGLWNNGVLDGMRIGRGYGRTLRKPHKSSTNWQ
jgi:hypothetical protein